MTSEIMLVVRDPRAGKFAPKLHGDVGFDIEVWFPDKETLLIDSFSFANLPTGLDIKIGDNAWGMIRARSSTIYIHNLFVAEGTIDPGYTGPLFVSVFNPKPVPHPVKNGDRLAQLVLIPKFSDVEVKYVEKLPETVRGGRGFGSTGF